MYDVKEAVFLIASPNPADHEVHEGFLARVHSMDQFFGQHERIYVEPTRENLPAFIEAAQRATGIYVQSLYHARGMIHLYPLLGDRIITEIHGVVPEEETLMHGDERGAYFGDLEEIVFRHGARFVAVTQAMVDHYVNKYGTPREKFIVLPTLTPNVPAPSPATKVPRRVLYAGGAQAWQKVDQLIDATEHLVREGYEVDILTPSTDAFEHVDGLHTLTYADAAMLDEKLREAEFGIILRDDNVINNVACPTKMNDYLSHDVIPVVHSPRIGDFERLGYQYLPVDDFLAGAAASADLEAMRAQNRQVMQTLRQWFDEGGVAFGEVVDAWAAPIDHRPDDELLATALRLGVTEAEAFDQARHIVHLNGVIGDYHHSVTQQGEELVAYHRSVMELRAQVEKLRTAALAKDKELADAKRAQVVDTAAKNSAAAAQASRPGTAARSVAPVKASLPVKILDVAAKVVRRTVLAHPGTRKKVRALAIRYIKPTPVKPKRAPASRYREPEIYPLWLHEAMPSGFDMWAMRREAAKLPHQPKFSVIVPVYNTDLVFLRECVESVLCQAYEQWELVLYDDASPSAHVREALREFAELDPRIKVVFGEVNLNIAGATNAAIEHATGDYISLFDHDDLLWPNALFEVAQAINEDPARDFIYTDEDKLTPGTHRHTRPFFKPDWNHEFMHAVNYITHFTTFSRELWDRVGAFDPSFNGAQDWDLFLRMTRSAEAIHHIPKVLYSWRVHPQSTAMSMDSKLYAIENQRRAIEADIVALGREPGTFQVVSDPNYKYYWRVTYDVLDEPLISIVIPSKNQTEILEQCLRSIYAETTYANFEVIVVDTGSDEPDTAELYERYAAEHDNFRMIPFIREKFSYAASCNFGAEQARGELLVMLNNDTEIVTPNWLELLAGDAQRPGIGAVGCLLMYPDGIHIQHAGVGVGLGGVAANSFQRMTLKEPMSQTQHLFVHTRHEVTAVTAACLMVRKAIFDEVGGFNVDYRITYNDVDLCLRIVRAGYRNLYTPYVTVLHHESLSLGRPQDSHRDTSEFEAAKEQFKTEWADFIAHDPHVNPNLTRDNARYEITLPKHRLSSEWQTTSGAKA